MITLQGLRQRTATAHGFALSCGELEVAVKSALRENRPTTGWGMETMLSSYWYCGS